MSEKEQVMPEDLKQFKALEAQNYDKNGANHVYGIDENGKKTHLKGDDVLAAYGYEDKQTELDRLAAEAPKAPENGVSRDELVDQYAEALKKGETDLSFGDWTLAQERERQAPWYTNTRAHGEFDNDKDVRTQEIQDRLDELTRKDLNGGLSKDEHSEMSDLIGELNSLEDGQANSDRKLQERLKGAPSEDDVDYYRWLKNQSGKAETGEEGPKDNGDEDKTEEVVPGMPEVDYPEEDLLAFKAADDEYIKQRQKMSARAFPTPKQKEALEEARQRRIEARDKLGGIAAAVTREHFRNLGLDEDYIDMLIVAGSVEGQLMDDQHVNDRIQKAQEKASEGKALGWFYKKWASWGLGEKLLTKANFKNVVKKVASMGVVGAAVAVPAAAVGGFFLGPIAGGAAGALLATRVARGFIGHKVNREADAITVAQAQNEHRTPSQTREELVDKATALFAEGKHLGTADALEANEENMTADQKRNRQRLGRSVLAGAAGFAAAEVVGGILPGGGGGKENLRISQKPWESPKFGTPEFEPPRIDTSGFKYPWNWAEAKFGAGNGADNMYRLAEAARADGHEIVWHNLGQPDAWVEIDGNSTTDHVVNILNNY